MSTRVVELYDTLRAAGVADDKAKAAASAVVALMISLRKRTLPSYAQTSRGSKRG